MESIFLAFAKQFFIWCADNRLSIEGAIGALLLLAIILSTKASAKLREAREALALEKNRVKVFESELGKLQQKLKELKLNQVANAQSSEVSKTLEQVDELVTKLASEEQTSEENVVEVSTHEEVTVHTGLGKTRRGIFQGLKSLFSSGKTQKKEIISKLEETLLSADVGYKTTEKLLAALPEEVTSLSDVTERLKSAVKSILIDERIPEIIPVKRGNDPLVVLVVGVNGVGKTTTIGKLAHNFASQGAKVLVGACDTFRAAAVEQLSIWATRAGIEIVSSPDAKPSSVAFDTIAKAKSEQFDVVIIDTAGRLHTRANLMNELASVVGIVSRELPGSPHETILVVDASTGQNALQQAKEFNDKVGLTGIVVTKLDGTPKGGIVVAIKEELNVPIRYIGVGEGAKDLRVFSADEFVDALFSQSDEESVSALEIEPVPVSADEAALESEGGVKPVRRRRREEMLVS